MGQKLPCGQDLGFDAPPMHIDPRGHACGAWVPPGQEKPGGQCHMLCCSMQTSTGLRPVEYWRTSDHRQNLPGSAWHRFSAKAPGKAGRATQQCLSAQPPRNPIGQSGWKTQRLQQTPPPPQNPVEQFPTLLSHCSRQAIPLLSSCCSTSLLPPRRASKRSMSTSTRTSEAPLTTDWRLKPSAFPHSSARSLFTRFNNAL